MATEYKSIEFRLHENLVKIQEYINLLEFDHELNDPIIQSKELLKSKKFIVAVMGEFKRGKSSLINALLGAPILPADATPTTATINRITYGTNPETIIKYKDGSSEKIDIKELCHYVTNLSEDGKTRASLINEAVIFFPTNICQNHVDIIDTPGLNDDEHMTQITIDMLQKVDGVVVPLHAKIPFSETEKKFVVQLIKNENIESIIFVVTFMDQLDEDDYVYESYMDYIKSRIQNGIFSELSKNAEDDKWLKKAHQLLENVKIIGISSSLALKSFTTNSQKDLRSSRFEEFKNFLIQTITARQLENAVSKSIAVMNKTISQFETQNQQKMAFYNLEARELADSQNSIHTYSESIKKYLDSVFINNYENLESILKSNYAIKNSIASEFVRALSSVKIDTHAEILKVLKEALSKIENLFQTDYSKTINAKLLESLKVDLNLIMDYREKSIADSIDKLKIDHVFSKDRLFETIDSRIKNISFKWVLSPIPEVDDLSQCNVIATAIDAIDVSITQWINDYQVFLVGVRKDWFLHFSDDADQMCIKADEQYFNLTELMEMRVKAHIKNFQVLMRNSEEVQAKSLELQQELLS